MAPEAKRAAHEQVTAAVRDRAQLESVRLRLLASWGSAIAERKDLPQFVQDLAALRQAVDDQIADPHDQKVADYKRRRHPPHAPRRRRHATHTLQ